MPRICKVCEVKIDHLINTQICEECAQLTYFEQMLIMKLGDVSYKLVCLEEAIRDGQRGGQGD